MRDRLTTLAEELLAQLPCGAGVSAARHALVDFVRQEIVPRSRAEESFAWAASDDRLQLVVRALAGNHRMLEVLADEISATGAEVNTAAAVGALVLLCDARWDGEDQALIPALAAAGADLRVLVG